MFPCILDSPIIAYAFAILTQHIQYSSIHVHNISGDIVSIYNIWYSDIRLTPQNTIVILKESRREGRGVVAINKGRQVIDVGRVFLGSFDGAAI